MGNKYVSPQGNDANNGLGPKASDASDKPWLTLEYAVDNMADGDVLYIAPGIYRDVITIGVTPTGETIIRGDPKNTQGFDTAAAVLLDAGPVIVTNLLTDDVTASTNSITIDTNGKDYLTLENLWVESLASASAIVISSASSNITIRNCFFLHPCGANATIGITTAADTTHNHLIERCILLSPFDSSLAAINIVATKTDTAEYDIGITIRNCTILSTIVGVRIIPTATATYFGTGLIVQNCTIFSKDAGVTSTSGYNASLTTKCQVKNCILFGGNGVVQVAGSAGDVWVEDYNFIPCPTPRTNVNAGGNSIAYGSSVFARSIRHDMGQAQLFGFLEKSFMVPWSTSRTIGYGNDSTPTALTVDQWNRPRPSGSGIAAASVLLAVGSQEYHNYGVKEITTKDAGDASIKLTGPGDHEIRIPVDASATTIAIKARFDSGTYGGANYPQAILLDATEIGVSTETETATIAASDAWETLTFTQFTPTAKGWVTIRLVNRGSGGDDICYFDTIAVT